MENETLQRLRTVYNSWNDSKGSTMIEWMNMMDDKILFRSLAGGAKGMEFTLDCHGKKDMQRYFDGLGADWEMIHYTPHEYISEGNRAVVLSTTAWRNRKTGKQFETPKADIFRFENGKIVEFFEFYDTARVLGCAVCDENTETAG